MTHRINNQELILFLLVIADTCLQLLPDHAGYSLQAVIDLSPKCISVTLRQSHAHVVIVTVFEGLNCCAAADCKAKPNAARKYNTSFFCFLQGHLSHVAVGEGEPSNHGHSPTCPTPDCSPPSPDTALKNIERVIRPQVSAHTHKH